MATKPHLYFVSGEWRAVLGIHHAVGATPLKAYRRLMDYRAAHQRAVDQILSRRRER